MTTGYIITYTGSFKLHSTKFFGLSAKKIISPGGNHPPVYLTLTAYRTPTLQGRVVKHFSIFAKNDRKE